MSKASERAGGDATGDGKNFESRADHKRYLQALFANVPEFSRLHAKVAPWLQVPPSFAALPDILRTLREFRSDLGRAGPALIVGYADIEKWVALFDASDRGAPFWSLKTVARYGTWKSDEGRDEKDAQPARFPLFAGIHGSNPVWCALFFMSSTSSQSARDWRTLADAYRSLQLWYLAAFIRLQRAGLSQERVIATRLEEAGRTLRVIFRPEFKKELSYFAAVAPKDILTAYEFLCRRKQEMADSSGRDLGTLADPRNEKAVANSIGHGYGALADLINQAWRLGHRSVFSSRQTSGRATTHRIRLEYDLIYPDYRHYAYIVTQEAREPEEDFPRASLDCRGPGADLASVLEQSGICPHEFDHEVAARVRMEDLDPRVKERRKELPPLASLYGAASARARAMAMEDQRFTTRLDRITEVDLGSLMTALERALPALSTSNDVTSHSTGDDPGAIVLETVLLLAVSLVTGTAPDEVCRLSTATDSKGLPRDHTLAVNATPGKPLWLRQYVPPDRAPYAPKPGDRPVATLPHATFEDVWSVGQHLGRPTRGIWFDREPQVYRDTFQLHIASRLKESAVPPRWRRYGAIGEAVPSWFDGIEEGEHLAVATLFGRDERLAATHRYYTLHSRESLARLYRTRMNDLWDRVLTSGFRPSGRLFFLNDATVQVTSWVGDDRAFGIDTMRLIAQALAKRVTEVEGARKVDIYALHNARAAQLAFVLAVVTGCRAVRTPIPDLRLIDSESGFMCLHEKDQEDGAHARIVWLPLRVRNMIADFLDGLRVHWVLLPAALKTVVRIPVTKARDRGRFDGRAFDLSLLRTIWFWRAGTEKMRYPVEWTGAELQQEIEAVAPGKWQIENAGRHFLRTLLTYRGCSATTINAHFGHASRAEHPYARESTFDPYRYREEISKHLEPLLDKLGYGSDVSV